MYLIIFQRIYRTKFERTHLGLSPLPTAKLKTVAVPIGNQQFELGLQKLDLYKEKPMYILSN
jgi:hypothetical protein